MAAAPPPRVSGKLVPGAGLQGQAWSPDGRRIAVAASNGSSSSVLYLTGLDGKGTIASHDFADELAWSADGRLLAYRGLRELRVVGRTGAPARHVPTNPRSIDWSKSGLLALDDGLVPSAEAPFARCTSRGHCPPGGRARSPSSETAAASGP